MSPRRRVAPRYSAPRCERPGGLRVEDAAFEDLLDTYANRLLYLGGLSPRTANTYARHLRTAYRALATPYPTLSGEARFLAATTEDLEDFLIAEGRRGVAASTRHTIVYSLRSLYTYLVEKGVLTINPARALKAPKTGPRAPEFYTESEVITLLDYAAHQAERDPRCLVGYVAMATFYCTGIRVGELAGLLCTQTHLEERTLTVIGKGQKTRQVPVDVTGAAVLSWYLDVVRPQLPGAAKSDYVFINPRSHRTGPHFGQFPARSLEELVGEFGKGAGLPGRHFPHRLRHTFATQAIQRGMSSLTLQGILGHSRVTTTELYVHMVDADRAAEHDRVFGNRPIPLPTAVAERPGALASVDTWVRTARQLAALAANRLQECQMTAQVIVERAEPLATPGSRSLVGMAHTVALQAAAGIESDYEGLLAEHGLALIEALTAITAAVEDCETS